MDIFRTPLKKGIGYLGLTIYMKPYDCGGHCLYCFTDKEMPRSSLMHEDTLRAKYLNWNAGQQLIEHYKRFNLSHNSGYKIGLNIMGGSFPNYHQNYIIRYIKDIYDTINGKKSNSLEESINNQRYAKDKIVYLMVQALPNHINTNICVIFKQLGVTEVQLGVQSTDETVLSINKRAHNVLDVVNATKLLKKYGFAVTYHMMIGMVGTHIDAEIKNILGLFEDDRFCPDYLKIFPCIAVKNTNHNVPINEWFKMGWSPLSDKDSYFAIKNIMENLPPFVGINRISRIVPPERILYGPRETINVEDFKMSTNCIWTRSLIYNKIPNYEVSTVNVKSFKQGKGCFYQLDVNNVIYGFLRIEFIDSKILIREFRVTGSPVPIGQKNMCIDSAQHLGVGKLLLKRLLNDFSNKDILVFPPLGCYDYFIKNGFIQTEYGLLKEGQNK
jgi:elongator complex protein 3